MSYYFTSDDLLETVKSRATIPDFQKRLTNAQILSFADEEMRMTLIPQILKTQEGFYLYREVIPLIAGKSEYAIPYRAIGSKLREIGYSQSDTWEDYSPMYQISIDMLNFHNQQNQFYFLGDKIVIPNNQRVGFLVMFYHMRPNRLVENKYVGKIREIRQDVPGQTILRLEPSSIPSTFTSTATYDLIKSGSNHGILTYDKQIISWDSRATDPRITFNTSDIPTDLVVGDRVALSNQTDIIACPTDLQPILNQATITMVLDAIADKSGLDRANAKLSQMVDGAFTLTANRSEGSAVKIVRRNGHIQKKFHRRGL